MPFTAAISQHPLPTHAVGEIVGNVLETVGEQPDIAILFVTGAFAGALDDMADAVTRLVRPAHLVGSASDSVLAGEEIAAGGGAAVLFAGTWNGRLRHGPRGLRTVVFDAERDGPGWQVTGDEDLAEEAGTLLLLTRHGDFPSETFLEAIHGRNPGLTVVGGSAAAPVELGPAGPVLDGRRIERGAIGLVIPDGAPVRALVSQGARAVGDPLVVTAVHNGMIEELAGRPALEQVLEMTAAASEDDRRALARSVHLGLVLLERADESLPGDVLVRRVPGADKTTGAVAVDADIEVGTTVQLQARDARSARDDLRSALAGETARGALVFGDLGVGSQAMSPINDHVSDRAVAGLSCSSEIGPIAGRPWLHHRSTAMLLFDD